ncbi:hypothetical protein RJ641_027719 [Dillenia turbinata]|uniref:Uncharacterized protein n=1 Tax=Dillenia turbinata TaxID=194707 RepID=A0AAN8WAK9_9MAGN
MGFAQIGLRYVVFLLDDGTVTEFQSFPNSSSGEPTPGSLESLMACSLPVQGDEETIGSKGVTKKQEFIKIIARALYSLGYDRSGALLEEESGIPLHSSEEWDESVATLHPIGLTDENLVKSSSFLILEQKFVELSNVGKFVDALDTLRNEIVPLCINVDRVHELAVLIIASQCIQPGMLNQDRVDAKVPVCINVDRVHELAALIVASPCIQPRMLNQDRVDTKVRSEILDK